MTIAQDFEDFVKLLNKHNVSYMVVGGYALAFHGKPRHTSDLDIWIGISEENAVKFDDAYDNKLLIDVDGIEIKYIGLADLKEIKKIAKDQI